VVRKKKETTSRAFCALALRRGKRKLELRTDRKVEAARVIPLRRGRGWWTRFFPFFLGEKKEKGKSVSEK